MVLGNLLYDDKVTVRLYKGYQEGRHKATIRALEGLPQGLLYCYYGCGLVALEVNVS